MLLYQRIGRQICQCTGMPIAVNEVAEVLSAI